MRQLQRWQAHQRHRARSMLSSPPSARLLAFWPTSISVRSHPRSNRRTQHAHVPLTECPNTSLNTKPNLNNTRIPRAAYQTWTVLTALPVTLFYFSVWKLALAGPEFSTLATLAPVLLASPRVREVCRTRWGRAVLATVVAGAGIGSWGAESVWARLGGVVVGTAAGVIRWAGEWEETAVEGGGHHGIGACRFHSLRLGCTERWKQCFCWACSSRRSRST